MVSPLAKWRALESVLTKGRYKRSQVCKALGISRSRCYYKRVHNESKEAMKKEIIKKSQDYPRYGYRRITALLRREGEVVNIKRVQLVRRKFDLQVSKRQRKVKRRGDGATLRQRATHKGHVWSWDFIQDQTVHGRCIRILTIIDEYTRQWVHFHLAASIRATEVTEALKKAMDRFGVPEHIRSDNGPIPRSEATT